MKKGIVIFSLVSVLFITFLPAGYASAEQKSDPCMESGIIVRNLTTRDLWYMRNGGDCKFWHHNHVLVIEPDDRILIFSDMDCEKTYCKFLTYKDYRSYDKNRDCRVRILPGCKPSDM